jgi:outer membrane protein assembly factor BamB
VSKLWAAALFLLLVLSLPAQDWLGFHGLEYQGVAPQAAGAVKWTPQIQTSWQVAIPGTGFSSPVVVGDRVYLTTAYETDRGARTRSITTVVSYVLAWMLLVLALSRGIRNSTPDAPKGTLVAAALLITAALFMVGMSAFGKGLVGWESSILRSWKIGLITSFVSLSAAWFLSPRTRIASLVFATAATLLSVFAYARIPNRHTFLDFSSSGGIIDTAAVIGPAIAGWGAFLVALVMRTGVSQAPGAAANRQRCFRARLFIFILPALLTAAAFAVLATRVPRTSTTADWMTPEFGWLLFGILGSGALLAVLAGQWFAPEESGISRTVRIFSVLIATALAAAFFLRFAAFPGQRQVAHAVASVSKRTGKLDWVREIAFSSKLHDFKGVNSRATPTLAAGSQGLAAFFGPIGLYGVSLDGKALWHSQSASFDTEFGVGHSPVIADGVVVLANEHEQLHGSTERPRISAYNISGGQLLWHKERSRTDSRFAAYSTPIVRTVFGRKVVLMRGLEGLTAYDLLSGNVVWTYPLKYRGDHLVTSAVIDASRAYVLDATRALALDLQKLADQHDPIVWIVPVPGEKSASPVIVDDLLFVATETGLAVCIDVAEGKIVWREKLGKRFFSSVVAHGNAIIFADETGELSFVKKSRVFELIARTKLNEKVYATPIPQVDGLLVRGATNLFCLKPHSSG